MAIARRIAKKMGGTCSPFYLGGNIFDKRSRVPRQQCFVASHARTLAAYKYESGRPHAKMVTLWCEFSGYNRTT
jgi:hypothetical protein